MHRWHLLIAGLLLLGLTGIDDLSGVVQAADRPNVVWIVSEDNSKHYLKMFDPAGAPTPNIQKLADAGLIFDRAFSNSPVCSVARTTLATCVYGPRIATQYHRKTKSATLPAGWKMFPAFLRDAGYFTTNKSKKDYNAVETKGTWNESSGSATWRKRKDKNQPFFHMESHGLSHESSLHFKENSIKPDALQTKTADVTIADYHPDTPLFRFTYARYLDKIRGIDKIVGATVAKLQEDGLLEDTFVFYFGDHGGVLPRGKGYIYESGLHVPLVVRIPENFKHLVDAKRGTHSKGFVEFVDFGATVLNLAGVKVPEYMDGKPFLGKGVKMDEVNARDETFGYADRFDEKYDHCRSLRKGRFKYLRNYTGYYPDGLQNNYRYRMLAYEQWRQLAKQGKLNAAQKQFYDPRPAEQLFDIEADPHEVKNLAGDPKYADTLKDLRTRLSARVKKINDLSMYPESEMVAKALGDPIAFGKQRADEIARLVDIADLALLPFDEAKPKLQKALASKNTFDRYWALIDCALFGKEAVGLVDTAKSLLKDEDPLVRLRAIEFLAIVKAAEPQPVIMDILKTSDSYLVSAITLNSVVYLRDAAGYTFKLTRQDVKARGNSIDRRLQYLAGESAAPKKPKKKKNRNKTKKK